MTINSDIVSLSSVGAVRGATTERTQAPARTSTASAASAPDRVELSLGKAQVDRLRQVADTGAEFRAEKVAALKKQIQDGTYQVEAPAVAAKMAGLFR